MFSAYIREASLVASSLSLLAFAVPAKTIAARDVPTITAGMKFVTLIILTFVVSEV